jgi:hypothetical protein
LNNDQNKIKKIAEKYREDHSGRFKNYLGKNNQNREYYSPELCKLIKEEIEKNEK